MKKISLTLAGLLCAGSAAVFAQQADTLNQTRPTQNQYRTNDQTPTTPAKPRTSGSEEAEIIINNSQRQNQPLPQNPTGSQGTVSGSTPYDTTNTSRPTGVQSTIGNNKSGTTSGTTGSGTYGTGTNGTGSGTKGTSSSYGTGNNSTSKDSTRHQQ
jgi:hypothetical protein